MAEIKITSAMLVLSVSLMTAVGSIYQGYVWINETVATKSDIKRLENLIKLNSIDANLNRKSDQLRQLERIPDLSMEEAREYELLISSIKRLHDLRVRLLNE